MITIVDYGRGNLFSLTQALARVGAGFHVTGVAAEISRAKKLILPGVGAFGDAAEGLRARQLDHPLLQAVSAGVPLLGICVGCQLLLNEGEEFGRHKGLGLIPGVVKKLPPLRVGAAGAVRLPNVGWRRLEPVGRDELISPEGREELMYFVHSYAPFVKNAGHAVAYLTVNGLRVPVAIRSGNVFGVQFHPEKSGEDGLAILDRFTKLGP